jgi:hypothetical protein
MKKFLITLTVMLAGSLAFADGGSCFQQRKDYDNAGAYQTELNAAVQWMAAYHNSVLPEAGGSSTADLIKQTYSFCWQFPINFQPQSLLIHFYSAADTCVVNADDLNNIQGQCYPN